MLGMKSITAKLAFGLLVIVSTVLLGFGYKNYIETRTQLNDDLTRDVDIVKLRMEASVPASLWNFETEILNGILQSEIKAVFVAGILVTNDSEEVVSGIALNQGSAVLVDDIHVEHSSVVVSDLIFLEDGQENHVGQIKIFVSDAHIQQVLRKNLEHIITQVVVTDFLILVLFYVLLRPIVGPLKLLTENSEKIAQGDYSAEVKVKSQDEVGKLAKSFDSMRRTIKKKVHDLASLNSVGEALTLTYDRNKALELVLNSISVHSHLKNGSIYIKDPESGEFEIQACYPEIQNLSEPRTFGEGVGIVGLAVQNAECVYVPDTSKDSRFVDLHGEGVALLCVPLIDGKETIGAINFTGEVSEVIYEAGDDEFMSSLARSLVITLKNISMREEIEEHNRTLEVKVQERTAALQSKTNDISAMMRNLHQGLFTILDDLTIHPEYSAFLEEIFNTNKIANEPFMKLLLDGALLNADQKDQIFASVSSLIGSEEMMWDFNAHILPNEIIRSDDGDKRVFELDWNPIILDDEIEKIMVTIRDVTELRKLQLEALEQRQELEIISQIINVDANKFYDFIENSQAFVVTNRSLIEAEDSYDIDSMQTLFRNMHTIKGNARTYGLTHITDCVHRAETTYDELRNADEPSWPKAQLMDELKEVDAAIGHYLSVANDKLGLSIDQKVDGLSNVVVSDLINTLESFSADEQFSDYKNDIHSGLRKLYSSIEESLTDTVSDVASSLTSLAQAVEKPAPEVNINCHDIFLGKQAKSMLNDVLMHCLRNSIDHGIESPEERMQKGKSQQGHITVETSLDSQHITLKIHDDGRGLALKKIEEKALKQGLIKDGELKTPNEIAEFIFYSGLSTAEKVSDISGRGVGMDAVRNFLRDMGGDITIEIKESDNTSDYASFETHINLPEGLYHQVL